VTAPPHLHAQHCGTGRGLEAHRAAGTPPCTWCLEAAGLHPGLLETAEKRAVAAERVASQARERARETAERAAAAEARATRAESLAAAAEKRAGEAEERVIAAGKRARAAGERARGAEERARIAEERVREAEARVPPPSPEPAAGEPGPPASVAGYARAVLADESLLTALSDVTAAAQRARAVMARHDLALSALAELEGVSLTPAGVSDGRVQVRRLRAAGLLHAALEDRMDVARGLWRESVSGT
jgi:hypothetical protein